jgi:DNA polymerase-3 subunit delta
MQLRYEQIEQHLQKSLAPLYLISGDVPLLVQETADAIRQAAYQQGFTSRQVFHVEAGFSWQAFTQAADMYSLFSTKELLEIRLYNASPGDSGSKALQRYAERLPKDKLLIITSEKIDASTQKTHWFQALAKTGVYIAIWPIEQAQLPHWIAGRLAKAGLKAEPDAIRLLAERSENNLLAAMQSIEKLHLLYGQEKISLTAMTDAIADSARFDVFALSDTIIQGNGIRIIRMLNNLHQEGIEATLILWALTRELRLLINLLQATTQGILLERAFQEQRIWDKRKPLLRAALHRHTISSLQTLLQLANTADKIIKGMLPGNVWLLLEQIALGIGGVMVVNASKL